MTASKSKKQGAAGMATKRSSDTLLLHHRVKILLNRTAEECLLSYETWPLLAAREAGTGHTFSSFRVESRKAKMGLGMVVKQPNISICSKNSIKTQVL